MQGNSHARHRFEQIKPIMQSTETDVAPTSGIPAWLRASSGAMGPGLSGARSHPFLQRTLEEFASAAASTLNGDRWARLPGYLQRRDPRAKSVAFLVLIAVATSLHSFVALGVIYAVALALTTASRIPLGMYARRVWLAVPIFVGAVALPAALNVVTPGHALFTVWLHPHVTVTAPGLTAAALLTFRVGVAVSLATLLTLTTTWTELLGALRAFLVPRLFITVLAMTYRYLVVFCQSAEEMFIARRSRTVGRATNTEARRFLGASMGALFGKTLALSEEVHSAMVSRGFHGEMRTLARPRWSMADSLLILGIFLVAVASWGGEYARFFR